MGGKLVFYWLSAPTPSVAGKQRDEKKMEERKRGHFCIKELERLIRTSWVKHEKGKGEKRKTEREEIRDRRKEMRVWVASTAFNGKVFVTLSVLMHAPVGGGGQGYLSLSGRIWSDVQSVRVYR